MNLVFCELSKNFNENRRTTKKDTGLNNRNMKFRSVAVEMLLKNVGINSIKIIRYNFEFNKIL